MKKEIPQPFSEPIFVTKPTLPPLEKVQRKLEDIYEAQWVTNFGGMHIELEYRLQEYLQVKHLLLFNNGTTALELAIRSLGLKGEVITTPFTFAATTHALALDGLTPVFCDIREDDFNLDAEQVEALITPNTSAIVAVHVFGNPCELEKLERIAKKHNLKLIYDAAHAFGVEVDGKGIGTYGDISMFSLHATKVFNTIEGGCLTFNDHRYEHPLKMLRNFGIANEEEVLMMGGNGKMNEIQAAFGLLNLETIDDELKKRQTLATCYRQLLATIPGIRYQEEQAEVTPNNSYFPVVIDPPDFGLSRDELYTQLKQYNIFTRKYFYPLCSHFASYRELPSAHPERLPVAEKISQNILCLPIYSSLQESEVEAICAIIEEIHTSYSKS